MVPVDDGLDRVAWWQPRYKVEGGCCSASDRVGGIDVEERGGQSTEGTGRTGKWGKAISRERDTDTDRQIDREEERDRDTDTERHRQTDRQTEKTEEKRRGRQLQHR